MKEHNILIGDNELDLYHISKMILARGRFIFKIVSLITCFGTVVAFTDPLEYRSSCILIPEALGNSQKIGGSLGGLASLAGVDLEGMGGSNKSTINPALYQQVSQSTPFLIDVMDEIFYFEKEDTSYSIYTHYLTSYEVGIIPALINLPFKVMGYFRSSTKEKSKGGNSGLLYLGKEKKKLIEDLKNRIVVNMDWDLNIITITVTMQDPLVSAQVADYTRKYIADFASEYTTLKSNEQFEFVSGQFDQKKKELGVVQDRLANFRDNNRNVTTAKFKTQEERLISEYNLAFNIFSQVAKQKESIKIQVEEDSPIFTILEPVSVPVDKNSPKRLLIIFSYAFFGLFITISFLLIQQLINNRKENIYV